MILQNSTCIKTHAMTRHSIDSAVISVTDCSTVEGVHGANETISEIDDSLIENCMEALFARNIIL